MKSWLSQLFSGKKSHTPEDQKLALEKQEMIEGIEGLAQTIVKEIMVPRIDVAFVNEDASGSDLVDTILESGHSRYPVFAETIDNVTGIVYAKDLLRFFAKGLDQVAVSELARKPYFVPESMRLDTLLREMKKRRVHIAIVVDEYGGVSGIVCMEDILEEIIGDIQDEFDNERDDIIPLGGNVFLCDARTSVDDINERLGLDVPTETFDTLGGYVFDLFGRIPSRFEKVVHEGVTYITQDMEGHKIKSIKVIIRQDDTKTANP